MAAFAMEKMAAEFPSKNSIKKGIKRGLLLIDGDVCNTGDVLLNPGQCVQYVSQQKRAHLARTGEAPTLDIAFAHADSWFAACIKPHGVSVQRQRHSEDHSAALLAHAVAWALPPPDDRPDALHRPRPVHRIDKETGGLVLFARTTAANASLCHAFQMHGMIHKTYLALIAGRLDGAGEINVPLGGKDACTRWEALEHTRSAASGWVTTMKLHPLTGRYHQLRMHMETLGCPILGDSKHCLRDVSRAEELDTMYLWASAIALPHPGNGEQLQLSTPFPQHFVERREMEEAAAASADPTALAATMEEAETRVREAATRLAASHGHTASTSATTT